MPGRTFTAATVILAFVLGLAAVPGAAQSPGYALRDPAVTGVPASPEPDISIPSGQAIDRCLFLGGELLEPDGLVEVTWMAERAPDDQTGISIIGKWNRTIGAARISDENGCLTSRSKPVTVTTYFRQRFGAIYEFNDTNGDGVASVVRNGLPIEAGRVLAREPVYKAVDLRVGWNRTDTFGGTALESGHEAKTFDFTLTATNLSYIMVGDPGGADPSPGDGKLNEVSFTFHVRGWFEPGKLAVPVFNITVDRSGASPRANATKAGTREFEDHTMKVKSKEDHSITGWDFDPRNTNPGLVLETDFTYGSFVPAGAPDWLTGELLEGQLGGAGSIAYKADGSGSETVVDRMGAPLDADGPLNESDAASKLGARSRIGLRDNWQEAGWFSWPEGTRVWSNESAGPADGKSSFQVQGARRFTMDLRNRADEKLVGVFVMGGFTYAGGPFYRVRHDPENKLDICFISIPDVDNRPPAASAAVPEGEFSYAESVALDGRASSDPDGDALACTWTEGSTVLGTGPLLERRFDIGHHRVTLTVDDNGSKASTSVSFDVLNGPPVARIVRPSKSSFTTDDTVRLDGRGSSDPENGTLAHQWLEGTKVLGTGPVLSRKFGKGDHVVVLLVTDEKGATAQSNVRFTVKEPTPGFGAAGAAAAIIIAGALAFFREKAGGLGRQPFLRGGRRGG